MIVDSSAYRFERKFHAERTSLAKILWMVRSHSYGLFEVYPSRYINNIYFDTNCLKSYVDNVEGVSDRHKIRLRWYGNDREQLTNSRLEIKIKRGVAGFKKSYQMRRDIMQILICITISKKIFQKKKMSF